MNASSFCTQWKAVVRTLFYANEAGFFSSPKATFFPCDRPPTTHTYIHKSGFSSISHYFMWYERPMLGSWPFIVYAREITYTPARFRLQYMLLCGLPVGDRVFSIWSSWSDFIYMVGGMFPLWCVVCGFLFVMCRCGVDARNENVVAMSCSV